MLQIDETMRKRLLKQAKRFMRPLWLRMVIVLLPAYVVATVLMFHARRQEENPRVSFAALGILLAASVGGLAASQTGIRLGGMLMKADVQDRSLGFRDLLHVREVLSERFVRYHAIGGVAVVLGALLSYQACGWGEAGGFLVGYLATHSATAIALFVVPLKRRSADAGAG